MEDTIALNKRNREASPKGFLDETRVRVPLNWESLHGKTVSETHLFREINKLPLGQLLPGLITLLQYGDASEPPAFGVLDRHIHGLFPTATGRRIAERLSAASEWVFFTKWQLLFAIKLLCTFGSRDPSTDQVSDGKFLDLLLMTNGFYPRGESDLNSPEGVVETVQRTSLLGYSLIQHERPNHLIGRYGELFGRLAASTNRNGFDSWVDIHKVISDKLRVSLDVFKAVLFTLYSKSVVGSSWPEDGEVCPSFGSLVPQHYFADMLVSPGELSQALEIVSTSPDEIREEHRSKYGDRIGNPMDLGILLRNPAVKLPNGSLAGISGQLLIQRYTCGLYWDIHDALPDAAAERPNRRSFQTFFGELHERYCLDVLKRIEREQVSAGRKTLCIPEQEYVSGRGSNPDSLMVETIGRRNTRCTIFEFKVGRPRYKDSIVGGDVSAFLEDVHRKIEDGLD